MKRAVFFLLSFFFSLFISQASENEKNFIKGSLSEKIIILQNLNESERFSVVKKALDFSIEHAAVLSEDEDFTKLALAAVTVLSDKKDEITKINLDEQMKISEKLMALFRLFKNKELKKAVMEKLPLYSTENSSLTVDFLNEYLLSSFKQGKNSSEVLESSIEALGKLGNEESLSIIYNIWQSKIWPEYQKTTDAALVRLSQESFADVIKIFSISTIEDAAHYFTLLHKSSKVSQNSLCDIAENSLLIAINNAEKLKAGSETAERAFLGFQIEAHEVLTNQKWSHASSVIVKNILLAKKSYDAGILGESDFTKLIRSSVQIPSHELAQSLCDMLSECNGKVESFAQGDSKMPAKSVVLALIFALGELGDKTAFDTLLYVTYISYPLEVIDAAKASLAKLQW
ncbi:MAG: hypothetical protein IJ530_04735 [Treponema sp.]|uniref:hypothetical protein n=1 Tax=Treponema sp. TaxID=166 RepID=UPI0025D6E366|nr:hypothetical protein [Treponema sp.]MBQ8679051.1 hypothetical protein [Treponema sp.]